MTNNKLIDLKSKKDKLKFPPERRKKVMDLMANCIEFKVSVELERHNGVLSVSHSDSNPINIKYYKLIEEYAEELCEMNDRLGILYKYPEWKRVGETFDYRLDLTKDTYLLLNQSDLLFELQLVFVENIKGKDSSTKIAQGLTSFIIDSANKYASDLLSAMESK